jgi:Tol biopolymer transport system component
VVDTLGSEPVRLTDNPGADGRADWSPDGRRIAFDAPACAMVDPLALEDEEGRMSSPDGRLSGLMHRPLYPVWSPDGTTLAFHGPSPFFARDPAWQDEIDRISRYFFFGTEDQMSPADSAFWEEWAVPWEVHTMTVDTTGANARDVTFGVGWAGHPEWAVAGARRRR